MKFSYNWVQQWCQTQLPAKAVADLMTMAGLEVDNCSPASYDFSGVVVGQVLECQPHPNADKLRVVCVSIGEREPLRIVCGAPNCKAGLRVAVAVVGAVLPGDFHIKIGQIRGETSCGMLCSKKELGFENDVNGIWELPKDAPLGRDLRDYLTLDDYIIDVDLTPNRADCFSIRGIARELSALTGQELQDKIVTAVAQTQTKMLPVEVHATQACPRYLTRIISAINTQAVTPMWIQEKLRRGGIRCLHPVVDILNFVMLELGQPMHAFDLNRIHGSLRLRLAVEGEKIILLDDQEITLQPNTLVIADEKNPVALAGLFGGRESAVQADTCDIVLESAFFAPTAITGRARQYGLHTDSSMRFERGVDFELQGQAMEYATQLILDVCGGEVGAVQAVVHAEHLPVRPHILLHRQRLKALLGFDIPSTRVEAILTQLGLQPKQAEQGWSVCAPSYRFDINEEVDLIEEVARIYGYDQIPAIAPTFTLSMQRVPQTKVGVHDLKMQLIAQGFHEVMTYSFTDPKLQQALFAQQQVLELLQPVSREMSVMRLSLWLGLLQTASYNLNRQQTRLRLFECGTCFIPDETSSTGVQEEMRLGGLMTGDVAPQQWSKASDEVDFFDLKGEVEALLDAHDLLTELRFEVQDRDGILHPGQSAAIYYQQECIGYLGALHPRLLKTFGLKKNVYLFELDIARVVHRSMIKAKTLSRFPSIRRDLAVVVEQHIPAQDVLDLIKKTGGETLVDINLFDIYQGETIGAGKKSLALSLTLQRLDKTLEDKEVNTFIEKVVHVLHDRLNASLRE